MRKESVCKFVSVLVLLCLFCGCSSGSKGVGAWISADSHKLTQAQMLADYDAMWKDIDENYPLMGVAERTMGKNFAKVKADYRGKVAAAKSDRAFFELMTECSYEFGGCGHMCIFNQNGYSMIISTYKKADYPQCKNLYKILDNPASKTFYSYTPTDIYAQEKNTAAKNGGNSGNINTKIIEKNKIAYLKIKSFGCPLVSVDAPKIADFFNQTKDYKDCIIDIRGNGGGAAGYWLENIVEPNVDHDVNFTVFGLVKGETARQYLSIVEKLYPISEFKRLPNTNETDLAQMKYFTNSQITIKSKTGKKAFPGKLYLLTDGVVYSSSEAFAMFCKQTGFAKIVGEPTGGDGAGTDPLLFVLPNSGIVLRFSASLGLNPDGSSNEEFGTQPDMPCAKGKDALQTCLDLIRAGQ
jgi:hypothetical protein